MRQSVRVTVAGMLLVGAFILAGCMVLDALAPPGPRGVTFTYVGDTVLRVGTPAAFTLTVTAQGVPLPQPWLRVEISPESTQVLLNVTGDSLIPCQAGQASLLVGLLHSSAAGSDMPDTAIGLRVTGGGPPNPRCP